MKPACLKFVGALALMLACLQGGASIQTYDRTGCRMGVWTEDLKAARTYAAEHQSMIIVSFMRNDGSCGVCNSVSQSLFETDEFKATAARLDMPLVIANYSGNTYASQQIDCAQYESFPVIVFLASDGTTRLAWSYVSNVQTGNGTAPVMPKPSKGFKIDSIKEQFWEIAQRLISVQTDAPVAKNPTGSYKHRNHAAFEIAADDRKTAADELKIHTIWDVDGWTNSLQVRHWMNGKTLWALYDKQFDWWKFRNGKAGTSYRITTPTLNDPLDIGVVCVYTNQVTAVAATTYDAAIANAAWTCKLSDLPAGGTFTLPAEIPANQEIFVLFTRRNRADDMEEITLDYTFTLQEVDDVSYWFTQQLNLGCEEGSTNEITVVRSSSVGAATAKFVLAGKDEMTDVTAFEPGDYAAAEEGTDFYFIDADGKVVTDHTVPFADGETRGTIRMVIPRGTEGVQTPDRAFGIRLDGAVGTDAGQYGGAVVVVTDKDKVIVETEGPQNAVGDLTTVECKLYDKDTEDVYTLTNLPQTAGSVYTFAVDTISASDFADGKIKVEVSRGGEKLVPAAFSDTNYDVEHGTMQADVSGYVFYIWGSDSEQGGDVTVKVSRAAGAVGECPNVKYQIQYRRFDRPVVSFAAAADALAPADLPAKTNVTLTASGFDSIKAFHSPFALDVAWKTADPESGAAAVANDDYVPVASSNCTFTAEAGTIALELLRHDGFSSPERSFVAELQPPPANSPYVLGAVSSHVFTFTADDAPAAATEAEPLQLAVTPGGAGQSAYLASGERNLSATNHADWIRYAVANTNGFFLLQTTNVTMRPAAVDARVLVFTNGVHDAALATYALSDLVDSARCLSFAGVTNKVIDVCVTRDGGDDVLLTYELKFREWQVAEGGELDEADPADDVRGGAVEFAVDADGAKTNAVRTLHGCGIAGYTNAIGQAVNDCADWFRFTGIRAGERYIFTASAVTADVPVTVSFYLGGGTEPTNQMTLAEFAASGWLHDAQTAEDVVVSLTRASSADQVAQVAYTLTAAKYVWPVVGFEKTAVEVTNDVASVTLKLVCADNPGMTVPANVYVRNQGGRSGYESRIYGGVEPSEVSFTVEQPEQTVAVTLNQPQAGVWTGDWKFEVYAEVDPELYRLADGASNVVVTVVDAVRQRDPTDPVDDEKSGAVEIVLDAATYTNLVGHLNGIDTGRDGAYSDRSDWLKIGWPNAETTCRLTLTDLVTNNCADVALAAEVYRGATLFKSLSFAELAKGLDVPMTAAGEVVVRLTRGASDQEVPVAVEYELEVEEVAWPTFTVAANSPTVTNDEESVEFTVTRGANLESADEVKLIVSDTNAVKVTEGDATMQVPFAAGAATAVVEVPLVPGAKDYWKRGGPFGVTLAKSTVDPFVRIISPSNATVRVVDASGIPENDYPADDMPAGAQTYPFGKEFQRADDHFAPGCTNLWLNGSDTNDWFKFTDDDPAVSNKYRLAVRDFLTNDADGLDMALTVYEGEQQAVPLTNTVLKAFERFDFRAQTDAGVFYVRVSRPYDGTRDVSVGYNLDFRKMPSAGISFVAAEGTVSEAAQAVYVELDCVVENEEPLEEDMVVTMTPTEIEEGGALTPAKPDLDYDPTPITVTWKAGTLGGIQRMAVPLCNYDPTWRGERSFNLILTSDSEAEVTTPDVMTVTILDSGYGTVGVTSTGDLTVPEGDFFPVRVERLDGSAGAVTGVWTWAVGKTKTVWKNLLFADRQAHATEVLVPVPVAAGYQATQAATLTFSIEVPAKTVTIRKGTPTSFKLTVLDSTYGGALSEYAAGDRSKIGFRTSGNWYHAVSNGVLAAGTPAAGKSEAMMAQVTGPCKIVFDAELTDPSATWLDVFVGATKVVTLTSSSNDVEVAVDSVGVKTVKFSFGRNAKDKTGVGQAFVSNIRFVRAEAANTFGTFAGVASIQPAGGVKIPGSMTLTMSGAGRLSGKVVAADRTWTFQQAKGGWDGNAVRVVAKSGTDTLPITLTVDPATGVVTGEATEGTTAFAAELTRSCWQEKPLAAVAAEKIAFFAGYYTLALPSTLDLGSDPEYGSGYLTMTVSDAGAVKVSGKFADGVSANGSGTLGFAADGTLRAYVFIKPAAYRTGWFVAALAFGEENGVPVVTRVVPEALAGIDCWVSSKSGDEFARSPLVSGGWYDRTENLHNYYYDSLVAKRSDGETDEVAVAFDESGNRLSVADYGAGLLTMSYTRQTGIFTGLARYLESTVSRVIKKAVSYRGVLIPNTAGDPAVGRGYFVRGGKSMEIVIEEK